MEKYSERQELAVLRRPASADFAFFVNVHTMRTFIAAPDELFSRGWH